MQIFLSHGSIQKPMVRELKGYFPPHLTAWLDEEKLLFGDSIPTKLEETIKQDTDYVLLFIDKNAAESAWVHKELFWALQAEAISGRVIVLPIVIDQDALSKMLSDEIKDRLYLRLTDYRTESIKILAEKIVAELFSLICRDMQQLRNPKSNSRTMVSAIANADEMLREHALIIQKAVFPHRQANPISKNKLAEITRSTGGISIKDEDFDSILSPIIQRNLIPGLSFDGVDAYLVEEHASWKARVQHEKKELIGRKAASYIQNGNKVFIDAGSTNEEIVRVIIARIRNRSINRLVVATTAINIADMISDCCVEMGFDDEFSAIQLYIPGGKIRPNTQAIVPSYGSEKRQVLALGEFLGGFDVCFVGVNGVDLIGGFTTHDSAEAANKLDIINVSKRRMIVGDSSKVGLLLGCKFSEFNADIKYLVNNDPENAPLNDILHSHADKVICA